MVKQPIEFDLTDDEPSAPLIHTCTVCGTTGLWGPEWSWYGAWRDVDNGQTIVKACSVACRKQHAADNGIDSGLVTR